MGSLWFDIVMNGRGTHSYHVSSKRKCPAFALDNRLFRPDNALQLPAIDSLCAAVFLDSHYLRQARTVPQGH